MNEVKKVCWNCNHCDTFGGVCLKGKFEVEPTSRLLIQHHTCEEFDDTIPWKTELYLRTMDIKERDKE